MTLPKNALDLLEEAEIPSNLRLFYEGILAEVFEHYSKEDYRIFLVPLGDQDFVYRLYREAVHETDAFPKDADKLKAWIHVAMRMALQRGPSVNAHFLTESAVSVRPQELGLQSPLFAVKQVEANIGQLTLTVREARDFERLNWSRP